MVYMDNVIAGRELVQLLQGQGDFSAPCFIALQAIFMEAVKELVVGEAAYFQLAVGKSRMYRPVDGNERNIVLPIFEDGADAASLLLHVA